MPAIFPQRLHHARHIRQGGTVFSSLIVWTGLVLLISSARFIALKQVCARYMSFHVLRTNPVLIGFLEEAASRRSIPK